MTRIPQKSWLLLLLFVALVLSCQRGTEQEIRLLGTWQLQHLKGVNTLLTFEDNGSFEVDQRIEGNLPNHNEKGGKAAGTWEMNATSNLLTLITTKGDAAIGWQPQTEVYHIVTFDALTLHLMSPSGKNNLWKKIKQNRGGGKDKAVPTLKIAPLVVNLAPSAVGANHHHRWICTEVIINFNSFDISAGLHPRVHEKTIFFLNSKTYDDMNTLDKLAATAEELKKALNPYLDHRILHLTFNNTVITGRIEAVEQFMAKYAVPEANAPQKH